MGEAGLVLANNLRKLSPFGDFSILWPALWVVGALLLGALIINYVKLWRQRPVSFHFSASEQLAHFRVLYESGKLSPDEFQRIEARLNARLKREMNLPVSPPNEAANAAAPSLSTGPGMAAEAENAKAGGIGSHRQEDRHLPPASIAKPADPGPEPTGTNGRLPSQSDDPNIQ
jgi:hypothetical protein